MSVPWAQGAVQGRAQAYNQCSFSRMERAAEEEAGAEDACVAKLLTPD